MSIGLSHLEEANKGAAHHNINIANKLYEAGISVRVFITPILPYIMNVEEMIIAIHQEVPVYLDKLRVFEKGNQNVKIYEWIKNTIQWTLKTILKYYLKQMKSITLI